MPHIRPLHPDDDLALLTAMIHRAYAPLATKGLHYWGSHQTVASTAKRVADGETWVIERDGRLTATITLSPPLRTGRSPWYTRPDVAHFHQFCVDPDHQGTGDGGTLMDHIEQRARELGANHLACDTSEQATGLIAMYERRGYRFIEHVDFRPKVNYRSVILSLPLAKPPTLYIMAGLPGSGKTTLSQGLARHLGATHLRIDTVEQALRDVCGVDVVEHGYKVCYRLAADALRLGQSVVVDSCNPVSITREAWREVATSTGSLWRDIEIRCSNADEHRKRVEGRTATVPDLVLPSWEQVQNREYHPWATAPLVVDTAGRSETESLQDLITAVNREPKTVSRES